MRHLSLLSLLLAASALRPTYFTCRHTYEHILQGELQRALPSARSTSPLPGLVRVSSAVPQGLDPVYALQTLPSAVDVSGASVSLLAKALVAALVTEETEAALRGAPRGSLELHELVPAMLKGTRKPALARRCGAIAAAVSSQLRKRFAAARPLAQGAPAPQERWLLQLLLLSPEELVGSLCRVEEIACVGGSWPCHHLPAGLAAVDLEGDVPSSAYRKLREALACMREQPAPGALVYDLGACPGGWTHALRLLGCEVVAVDRSPLAPALMKDAGVTFVRGDAFAYEPERAAGEATTWMVSDVIAYPERVAELLRRWCGAGWAARLVVTVKFQGEEPSWDALQEAIDVAEGAGFACRAKHFFNNKNEVTLMIASTGVCRSIGSRV